MNAFRSGAVSGTPYRTLYRVGGGDRKCQYAFQEMTLERHMRLAIKLFSDWLTDTSSDGKTAV